MAGLQPLLLARNEPAFRVSLIGHRTLGAAQNADKAPGAVVMHRRLLPRPPDEADDREAAQRVRVQQILAVDLGVGPRVILRQPVVLRDEPRQQRAQARQQRGLIAGMALHHAGGGDDEIAQAVETGHDGS